MKIIPVLLLVCMAVLSCNNNDSTDSKTGENNKQKQREDSTTASDQLPAYGCYLRVLQKDSFVARLLFNDNRVSGNLRFDNFEKDGSSGSVDGTINNNTIQLIYTFQSEGTTSVMEVYFKTDGNNLIRGVGDMITRNDTVYFKNPDAVQYPPGEKWGKVDCNL